MAAHRFLVVVPSAAGVDVPGALVAGTGPLLAVDARFDDRAATLAALQLGATATDEELVEAAWRRWGPDLTDHLSGDFAIARWDPRRRELFVARDHMGVRPLLMARFRDGVAVSPDLGRLLALPVVDRRPDHGRIAELLIDWWHDHRATFYRGIRRLPGGHRAIIAADGTIREERYWHLSRDELVLGSDAEYEARFRELFERAVTERLPDADRVAVELSGGIDSASIAGFLTGQTASAGGVLAVAGSFADARYEGGALDEGAFRTWFRDREGAVLEEFPAREAVAAGAVDASIRAHRAPIGGSMILLRQHLYASAAAAGRSVVFDGQDGDTSVGYGHERMTQLFWRGRFLEFAREMSAIGRRRGPRFALYVTASYSVLSPMAWAAWQLGRRPRGIRSSLATADLLHDTRTWERVKPVGTIRPDDVRGSHILDVRAAYNAFALESTDALARAAGLDARHPFYDRRLIEFCVSLPADQLFRRGVARSIQRRALAGIAPEEVLWRKDKGALPQRYIADALEGAGIHDLIRRDGGSAAPFIDRRKLRETYEAWTRTASVPASYSLYPVVLLDRWLETGDPQV
jgi:asparagine synthase (glutamine-hydrolysing)